VRDEKVGKPQLLLEVPEQVHDLRLDGHIQRARGSSATRNCAPTDSTRATPTRRFSPPDSSCGKLDSLLS